MLGQGAFGYCKDLKHIRLNEGLEVLGTDDHLDGGRYCGVFEGSALESVEFPASLRTISQGAFAECKNLKTVKFNEGLEVLGTGNDSLCYGVFQHSAIESVQLPSTLRRIEQDTFDNCKNL